MFWYFYVFGWLTTLYRGFVFYAGNHIVFLMKGRACNARGAPTLRLALTLVREPSTTESDPGTRPGGRACLAYSLHFICVVFCTVIVGN